MNFYESITAGIVVKYFAHPARIIKCRFRLPPSRSVSATRATLVSCNATLPFHNLYYQVLFCSSLGDGDKLFYISFHVDKYIFFWHSVYVEIKFFSFCWFQKQRLKMVNKNIRNISSRAYHKAGGSCFKKIRKKKIC